MSKGIYQDAIQTIDILLDKGIVTDKAGKQLFGDAQWENLRQWFKINGSRAVFLTMQALNKRGSDELKALRLRCEQNIERINREEADRSLRNQESLANINGVKHAKITSWVAIVISVASLIVAILSATVWK